MGMSLRFALLTLDDDRGRDPESQQQALLTYPTMCGMLLTRKKKHGMKKDKSAV